MAKNTHAFQNDIKHYDKIRDILRYLYLYGSSSKEELVEKGLVKSISSFYDIRQRIENYLDGEYLQEHKSSEKNTGKKFRFLYDPFRCPVNYLAETYQNCSFVTDDIIFYFCLMQSFVDPDFPDEPYDYLEDSGFLGCPESIDTDTDVAITDLITIIKSIYVSNQSVLQHLNDIMPDSEHNKKLFTWARIRARIAELTSLGILAESGDGRYLLSSDIFAKIEADELSDVQLMTQFFYNCSFLTVPGFYLSSTIGQYSQAVYAKETDCFFNKQENPVFFYKNHRLQSVIDDDVTWTILTAIHSASVIHYSYRTKNGELLQYDMLPMKVVIDRQYGRQYFFGYNYNSRKFYMPRISSIAAIRIDPAFDKARRYEFLHSPEADIHAVYGRLYQEHIENVWNIALGDTVSKVIIHFTFPEREYAKLLNRVKSARHHGTVTERGNGRVDFVVETKNELELVPWIRSYGPYAVVDVQNNPELAAKLKSDWKEALKLYGIVQ
ncbi:MAG: WYL domain-containing protein [Lachnospiraceae bacterium]|nr:WYL domain-containing protein [Lachnospiraceae bacterium]